MGLLHYVSKLLQPEAILLTLRFPRPFSWILGALRGREGEEKGQKGEVRRGIIPLPPIPRSATDSLY